MNPSYMNPTISSQARTHQPQTPPHNISTKNSTSTTPKLPKSSTCSSMEAHKHTCSSTLKNSKFPTSLQLSNGATESQGSSKTKVCPYNHCSLNSHHDAIPLSLFVKAKRKQLSSSKQSKKTEQKQSKKTGEKQGMETEQVEFFVETVEEERRIVGDDGDYEVEKCSQFSEGLVDGCSIEKSKDFFDCKAIEDDCQLRFSAFRDCEIDLGEFDSTSDSFSSDFSGSLASTAENLSENEEMCTDVVSVCSNRAEFDIELSNSNNIDDSEENWEPEKIEGGKKDIEFKFFDIENRKILSECQALSLRELWEGVEKCENSTKNRFRRHSDSDFDTVSNKMKLRMRLMSRKMVEEAYEMPEFIFRGPNFLDREPDPDSEKVDLRHSEMDERKNSEEWMIDCALQRALRKLGLGLGSKQKVGLLVEAFEAVTPPAFAREVAAECEQKLR